MSRFFLRRAIGLLALALLAGCAAQQPVYDGQVAAHSVDKLGADSKAIFANQVPVMPGAKFTETSGGESWGDEADSYSQSMTWWFSYAMPREKVEAFYDAALPAAGRSTIEGGAVVWTLKPSGGQPHDEIRVVVDDKELRITEDVQGGRSRPS